MASSMQGLAKSVNKLIYVGSAHPGLQMIGTYKDAGISI